MHKPWRVSFHRDDDRATGAIRPVVGVPGLCGGDGALNLGRAERTSGRGGEGGGGGGGGGEGHGQERRSGKILGSGKVGGSRPRRARKTPKPSLIPKTSLIAVK